MVSRILRGFIPLSTSGMVPDAAMPALAEGFRLPDILSGKRPLEGESVQGPPLFAVVL